MQSPSRLKLRARARAAFLGAAIGDALGWPQEERAKRKGPSVEVDQSFRTWIRQAGGRFYPHSEEIAAGNYSDDTQLILATARSLLHGSNWWEHFATQELPAWTVYERGGGGATKRAAQAWLSGRAPWDGDSKSRRQYYDAGGNGVAMRILPHAVRGAGKPEFVDTATNIIADGICTHGHPRALLGALAYGFAAWNLLRRGGTLPYGELLETTLSACDLWAVLPKLPNRFDQWLSEADIATKGTYRELWKDTTKELVSLLMTCKKGLKQGALAIDKKTMDEIGCFDRKVNGSGTIAAATAIFLASRYAVDPMHGVLEAAFATGADTDTIASMTGGLLGAIHGGEWPAGFQSEVQDSEYLVLIATQLVEVPSPNDGAPAHPVRKVDLERRMKKLGALSVGDRVELADSRTARLSQKQNLAVSSTSMSATRWQVRTDDGQTIYIKRLSRSEKDRKQSAKPSADPKPPMIESERDRKQVRKTSVDPKPPMIEKVWTIILCDNIIKARAFYSQVLGLKCVHESAEFFGFEQSIALVPSASIVNTAHAMPLFASPERPRALLRMETGHLEETYAKINRFGAAKCGKIESRSRERSFRCEDPDGTIIEVVERRP